MPYMNRFLYVFLLCIIATGQIAGQSRQLIHQGSIEDNEASGNLAVSLTKDQTVSYAIELSSDNKYGASVLVEGFNHEDASLFRTSTFTGPQGDVKTVTLPAGSGHLVPYRGTAHTVGRPAYLVVTSLNNQVSYSVFESKTDREGYNEGGVARAQAKEIAVFETVKGNVHWIEGNAVTPGDGTEPGGQWFKVTLEPRQTIRPYGTALGPATGAAFQVRLYDESGSYLTTLLSIPAYGSTTFPSTQAPGAYLYQNTAAVAKTVYLQVFAVPGIVHDFQFSLVEIMMDISLGNQVIDPQNNYSEDRTIHISAVRGDTHAPLTDFTGYVDIVDKQADQVYSQNGGYLPASVRITAGSGGVATFVARSKVGPRQTAPIGLRWPRPAWLTVGNFRHIPSNYLEVPQWVSSSPHLHNKADGDVPDWMQRRLLDVFQGLLDVFEGQGLVDRAVLNSVENYGVSDLGYNVGGRTTFAKQSVLPILLNPFLGREMRLNSTGSTSVCGTGVPSRVLSTALFHEARHAYQASMSTLPGNDSDGDYLVVNTYPDFPTEYVIDSTEIRDVCEVDPETGISTKKKLSYKGPTAEDSWEHPDYALWALEYDAYVFGTIPRTY